jgi:hypothetical protein
LAAFKHFRTRKQRSWACDARRTRRVLDGMVDANGCAMTRQREHAMFAYFFILLRGLLERAEHSRRDAYLAVAVDIVELERRMRLIEANH